MDVALAFLGVPGAERRALEPPMSRQSDSTSDEWVERYGAVSTLASVNGDLPGLSGPFDIVGDVHGCGHELDQLLLRLGWHVRAGGAEHPKGRIAVFVGDLVDRGPSSVDVLRLVMRMVEAGTALAVPGNHDARLAERLLASPERADGRTTRGLEELEAQPPSFRARVARFVEGLPGHLRLDGGRLIVAHAGLRESLHEDFSEVSRRIATFGEHTGAEPGGRLIRRDWAAEYRGGARVVHGHTRVREPRWRNRTIDVDTGCAKGGRLTAVRYPELELVSVPAGRLHAGSAEAPASSPDGGGGCSIPTPNIQRLADQGIPLSQGLVRRPDWRSTTSRLSSCIRRFGRTRGSRGR